METKVYRTKVSGSLITENYVMGRISGVMDAICNEDPTNMLAYASYNIVETNEETKEEAIVAFILTTKTTSDRYERFLAIVKAWYPTCTIETKISDT